MLRHSLVLIVPLFALTAAPTSAHEPRSHDHDDPPYSRDDHHHGRDHRDDRDDRDRGRWEEQRYATGWSQRVGFGAGYFAPWQGDGGHQAQLELLAVSPSGRFRIGGDFAYREYETRIFNVKGVEVDSYSFDILMHWVLNPGGFTPYLGAGIGLQANDFKKRDLVRGNPLIDVRDDLGLGYGVFGLLGFELPFSPNAALFAEGRLNLAYQVTGQNGNRAYADFYKDGARKSEVEDLGGPSAIFGVRVAF